MKFRVCYVHKYLSRCGGRTDYQIKNIVEMAEAIQHFCNGNMAGWPWQSMKEIYLFEL